MTSTYLYVRGRVLGPFSPVDIRAWRLEQGALGEETLVWNWHTNAWIPIDGFLGLQVAPAGPRGLAVAPVSTASSQGNTVSRTEPNVVKVIAVLVTILGVILLMIAFLPEPGPARSDPNVDSIMTSCMREAINSSGGNHAAAILQTQSLIDCAQSELGASTEWSCDDGVPS